MLRTVHLYGALANEFGDSFRFDTTTAADTLRALNCAFPGKFVAALEGHSFRLVRGEIDAGMDLDIEDVKLFKLGEANLHLIPVAEGAMSAQSTKGTVKIVLGAALVGTAIFMSDGMLAAPLASSGIGAGMTWGNIAILGLGLALAGVSTLLTKSPAQTASNDVSTSGSATGDLGQEGAAIPLVYGRVLTPGIPISVSSQTEDIDVYANSAGSIEAAFGNNPSFWGGY
jgi:predicted phage tail protein